MVSNTNDDIYGALLINPFSCGSNQSIDQYSYY